jgi:ppGpp synthetase/RelA/SpoT-type nucleotidyltranferase
MAALIADHFPYWCEGQPPEGQEAREAEVKAWLAARMRPYQAVATALIARIEPLLAAVKRTLPDGEKKRFLYRIDAGNIVKSPESILERMARAWCSGGRGPRPPIGFDDLRQLKDLGRFRVVANFLSDAERIREYLEGAYDPQQRGRYDSQELKLSREFMLSGNAFEDLIALAPADRKSGERCFKGLFSPREGEHSVCSIEVQIVTAFQEAWDKKDHFLIYERRRMGHVVQEEDVRVSFALSEQLYLTDLAFDRLKRGVSAAKPGQTSHHE